MKGVKTLTVKGAITLQNYIAVDTDADAFEIVIEKGANADVNGVVNLQVNMTNHGRITIPTVNDRLAVNSGAVLTNREVQGEKATGWWTANAETGVEEAGGVIDNYSVLAIVSGSNGEIHNYGTINIWNAEASTLISSNSDNTATITKPFTNEEQAAKGQNNSTLNRIGTINLLNAAAGENNNNKQ